LCDDPWTGHSLLGFTVNQFLRCKFADSRFANNNPSINLKIYHHEV
jgi:hypothetical protein